MNRLEFYSEYSIGPIWHRCRARFTPGGEREFHEFAAADVEELFGTLDVMADELEEARDDRYISEVRADKLANKLVASDTRVRDLDTEIERLQEANASLSSALSEAREDLQRSEADRCTLSVRLAALEAA